MVPQQLLTNSTDPPNLEGLSNNTGSPATNGFVPNSTGKSSTHQAVPLPSNTISYAQIAKNAVSRNGRRHQYLTTLNTCASTAVRQQLNSVSTTGQIPVPYLLRRGTEDHSVFFDVSPHPIKEADFFTAARNLVPNWDIGIGMIPHREEGRLIYEMTMPNQQTCDSIVQQGLQVDGYHYPAICSLPLTKKIIKLELERLPTSLPAKELEEGLRAALSPFGSVLHLGLYRATAGWFQGYGCAVLANDEGDDIASGLSHRIEFGLVGSTIRHFYATWKDMGAYCRYCHDDTHTIDACPTLPAQGCFNCSRRGRKATDCPHPHREQPRKTPKVSHAHDAASNPRPTNSKQSAQTQTRKMPSTPASSAATSPTAAPSTSPKNFIRLPVAALQPLSSVEQTPSTSQSTSELSHSEADASDMATPLQRETKALPIDMKRAGEHLIDAADPHHTGRVTRSKAKKNTNQTASVTTADFQKSTPTVNHQAPTSTPSPDDIDRMLIDDSAANDEGSQ
ncbi:uncharacterized protein BYT42DRAFT_615214 [Radiomyces spectabilis]|uniref:uncharacterized protein n=1 Tax=Radiomyces spectabilis TaxID=64574 RepID=UPI00221FC377|nr:uncharacterized protein BYT42DRAFT_615214 [Radiomyces spectabilis]KAI8376483.1 hypothetical protein BYT42DRAFT_615214 [Radiomyces spectabilis]